MTPTNDNATAGLVERLVKYGRYWQVGDSFSEDRSHACNQAADTIIALQARVAEVERQRDEASDQADDWCKLARAALSRVTEAKAEGMREAAELIRAAFDIQEIPVMGETVYGSDLGTAVGAYQVILAGLAQLNQMPDPNCPQCLGDGYDVPSDGPCDCVKRALAQSGGADPAQGKGDEA